MKKLMLLITGLFMVTMLSFGQASVVLQQSQNSAAFNVGNMSSAFVTKTDSLAYNEFSATLEGKQKLQFYSVTVSLSGVTTTVRDIPLVTSVLYSGYGDIIRTSLGSVDWHMTTADTTFQIRDISTGTDADYLILRNTLVSDSTSVTVEQIEVKVTNK